MDDPTKIPQTLVEQLWKKYLQQTPPPMLHSSIEHLALPQLPQDSSRFAETTGLRG